MRRPCIRLWSTAAGLLLVVLACGGAASPTVTPASTRDASLTERIAPHFVDASPRHGDAFALMPTHVVINFDFALSTASSITVSRNGAPIGNGPITLGPNNISMTSALPANAGDGSYTVDYRACWADGSCNDGRYAFQVQQRFLDQYVDMRGRSQVQIDMRDIKFQAEKVIVSKGTTIVWTNRDAVIHFMNTDPHPSHNFLPSLNSLELKQGDTHSFTFAEPGEWPYHCSAHYPSMVGRIVVE